MLADVTESRAFSVSIFQTIGKIHYAFGVRTVAETVCMADFMDGLFDSPQVKEVSVRI
jgi:hypothetical protein